MKKFSHTKKAQKIRDPLLKGVSSEEGKETSESSSNVPGLLSVVVTKLRFQLLSVL